MTQFFLAVAIYLIAASAFAQNGTSAPPAASVTDPTGGVWTVGSDQTIQRNGIQMGGGRGSVVYLADGVIYVLGTGTPPAWWRWVGIGATTWVQYGPTKPPFTQAVAKQPLTIGPRLATFTYPDADFNTVSAFLLESFRCDTLTAGVCVGRATQPFQPGLTVPAATVTTLEPPSPDGANRQFNLMTPPVSGLLNSFPVGVTFVATITAIPKDPTASASARSDPSNPFQSEPPASPCIPIGQPGSLAVTMGTWTTPVKANAKGYVLFDIATTRPITMVELQVGTPVISRVPAGTGGDMRNTPGIRFTAPATPGTYRFKVKLTDLVGCTYESGLIREITVTN